METTVTAKICTVEKVVRVEAHPNADRLDILTVQGYETVSAKGHGMEVGQKVLFVHPDSIVPHDNPYFDFMKKCKFHVKPIRLRGIFSAGLVINPAQFPEIDINKLEVGDEVGDTLDITHYTKPVPGDSGAGFKGGYTAGDFPVFLRKTDEINLRGDMSLLARFKNTVLPKYPSTLAKYASVVATLKIDGTSATFAKTESGEFSVSSRNREIKRPEDLPNSVYWDIAKKFDIEKVLAPGTCIQGEIYGPGIQKNPLKMREVSFAAFSLFDIATHSYKSTTELFEFCDVMMIPHVEVVEQWDGDEFVKEQNLDTLKILANSVHYGTSDIPGEGIVVRHVYWSEQNFIKSLDIPSDKGEDGADRHLFELHELPYFSFKLINENYKD